MCPYIFVLFHANEIRKDLMTFVELIYKLICIRANICETKGECYENFTILLEWAIFLNYIYLNFKLWNLLFCFIFY